MSDSDFDEIFGGRPAGRSGFTERFGGAATSPPPKVEAPAQPTDTTDGQYRPYGSLTTGGIIEGCDVQRWMDGTDIPEGVEIQYRFLTQIAYHGEEQLKLFMPDCIVVIEGKHLRDLRKKLARRAVTFIQQFNARVWLPPPDGQPIIDSIEIIRS